MLYFTLLVGIRRDWDQSEMFLNEYYKNTRINSFIQTSLDVSVAIFYSLEATETGEETAKDQKLF